MIDSIVKKMISLALFILFTIIGANTIFVDMLPCFRQCLKSFKYIFYQDDQVSYLQLPIYCNYYGSKKDAASIFFGHLLLPNSKDPGKVKFSSADSNETMFLSTEEDFYIKEQKENIYGIRDLAPNRLFLGINSNGTNFEVLKYSKLDSKIKIVPENLYYADIGKFSAGLASFVVIAVILLFTLSDKKQQIRPEPQKKRIIILD